MFPAMTTASEPPEDAGIPAAPAAEAGDSAITADPPASGEEVSAADVSDYQAPEPPPTAEERLLETIVSDPRNVPDLDEAADAAPLPEDGRPEEPGDVPVEVANVPSEGDGLLRAELEMVRADLRAVTADRDDVVHRLELAAVEFERLHEELDAARRERDEGRAGLSAVQAAQADSVAAVEKAREETNALRRQVDEVRASRAAEQAQLETRERKSRDALREAEVALRDLRAEQTSATRRRIVLIPAGAVLLVLLAGAGGYGLGRAVTSNPDALRVSGDKVPAVKPEAPFVPAVTASGSVARTPPTAVVVTPWPAIRDDRITAREEADSLWLVFNEGPFTRAAELSPAGRQDLRRLAAALKPYTHTFRIEVEGHTDPSPVTGGRGYANNRELGLSRARAAQDVLIREGGLPASSLSLSSAGDTNPPFPGETPEARRRNRTVVIKLHAIRSAPGPVEGRP